RGAASATLVEADRLAIKVVEENARALALSERARILRIDLGAPERLVRALAGARFDLIFLDPPYASIEHAMRCLEALARSGTLAPAAVVVIEHARRGAPTLPEGFREVSTYRYGDTAVVLAHAPEELP
ncbi:MAG: RsmD family RNA methyltransferase, partial [Sandaracinaceae bacterium]|nr:RsmD family RNA methyltransferase [Sandaracinaceae bacterium]